MSIWRTGQNAFELAWGVASSVVRGSVNRAVASYKMSRSTIASCSGQRPPSRTFRTTWPSFPQAAGNIISTKIKNPDQFTLDQMKDFSVFFREIGTERAPVAYYLGTFKDALAMMAQETTRYYPSLPGEPSEEEQMRGLCIVHYLLFLGDSISNPEFDAGSINLNDTLTKITINDTDTELKTLLDAASDIITTISGTVQDGEENIHACASERAQLTELNKRMLHPNN